MLAAVAPLGPDYVVGRCSARSTSAGSICSRPTGKRSGAYSNGGAYDVHPYMLINYNGQVRRREHAGARARATRCRATSRTRRSRTRWRTIRSSWRRWRPRSTSRCSSTTCSNQIKDDDTRLSLLGNYLENIKGTVFRQTQFAEFELRMHEMAQKGEPITGDALVEAVPGHHEAVLRPRPGRLRRGRLHRPRVELHPALLPRLLRLPVRRPRSPPRRRSPRR